MSKNDVKTLPVRGMRVPRLLIWTRGLIHGKVLHSAGQDDHTQAIISSYITGQTRRFREECSSYMLKVEKRLKNVWVEADALLIDLARMRTTLTAKSCATPTTPENNDQLRAQERDAQYSANLQAEQQAALKQLSVIRNVISSELLTARNRMESTSERLLSTFSAYGHGVLLIPIRSAFLPEISFDEFITRYMESHEETWNAILKNTKEVLA